LTARQFRLTLAIVDPDCDIAVATMAQLLLQQGRVTEALTYFERAAELSRTQGEIVNALSYAEATRTQLEASHPSGSQGVLLIRLSRFKRSTHNWQASYRVGWVQLWAEDKA